MFPPHLRQRACRAKDAVLLRLPVDCFSGYARDHDGRTVESWIRSEIGARISQPQLSSVIVPSFLRALLGNVTEQVKGISETRDKCDAESS